MLCRVADPTPDREDGRRRAIVHAAADARGQMQRERARLGRIGRDRELLPDGGTYPRTNVTRRSPPNEAPSPDVKASWPDRCRSGDVDVELACRSLGVAARHRQRGPGRDRDAAVVDDLAADGGGAAGAGVDADAAVGGVGERPRGDREGVAVADRGVEDDAAVVGEAGRARERAGATGVGDPQGVARRHVAREGVRAPSRMNVSGLAAGAARSSVAPDRTNGPAIVPPW